MVLRGEKSRPELWPRFYSGPIMMAYLLEGAGAFPA